MLRCKTKWNKKEQRVEIFEIKGEELISMGFGPPKLAPATGVKWLRMDKKD